MDTGQPTNIIDLVNKAVRTSRDMARGSHREPTAEELGLQLDIPADQVRKLLEIARTPIQLNS